MNNNKLKKAAKSAKESILPVKQKTYHRKKGQLATLEEIANNYYSFSQQTILRLENQIRILQDQLNRFRRQDSGYDEDEDETTEYTQQIAQLQEQLAAAKFAENQAKNNLTTVEEVNQNLQHQLNQAQTAAAFQQQIINTTRKERDDAITERDQKEAEHQAAVNAQAQAENERDAIIREERDNLQQQLQDQQEQNRHSQANLDHQIEQNDEQRRQYLLDIGTKNEHILFLAGQINNLQTRLTLLLNQKQVLQNKLTTANEKVNNLAFE